MTNYTRRGLYYKIPPFSRMGVREIWQYELGVKVHHLEVTHNDGRVESMTPERFQLCVDLDAYFETEEKANKIIKERAAAELKRTSNSQYMVIYEETGEIYIPHVENDLVDNIYANLNKIIKDVKLVDDDVVLTFLDSSVMVIHDRQSCCEHRYFTTDDKLDDYKEVAFLGIVIKNVELESVDETDDDDDVVHDIAFMEIKTNKGSISFAAHNEHNGHYGGINISVHVKPPLDAPPTSLQ